MIASLSLQRTTEIQNKLIVLIDSRWNLLFGQNYAQFLFRQKTLVWQILFIEIFFDPIIHIFNQKSSVSSQESPKLVC